MQIPDTWAPLVLSSVRDAIRYTEGFMRSDTIRGKSDYEEHHLHLTQLLEYLKEEYKKIESTVGLPLEKILEDRRDASRTGATWKDRSVTIEAPRVLSVGGSLAQAGDPEVVDVAYDASVLRVTLAMANDRRRVCVTFDAPVGFRVLDEGDLCEFWSSDVRAVGWLWEIAAGGWLDLERSRPTFIAGMNDRCREFLVLGCDACVSVISRSEPSLHEVAA